MPQTPIADGDFALYKGSLPYVGEKDAAGTKVVPSLQYVKNDAGLFVPVSSADPMPTRLTGASVAKATGAGLPAEATYVAGDDNSGNLRALRLDAQRNLLVGLRSSSGLEPSLFTSNGVGDGDSAGRAGLYVHSRPQLHNGSTYDFQRNNTEGTLLASAARTARTTSPDQTNHNASGVTVTLDVTANPGGAETLTLNLQLKDPASGKYVTIATTGALPAATNATYVLQVCSGDIETTNLSQLFVQGIALPRTWRIDVNPSGSGSWTYSAGLQYSV